MGLGHAGVDPNGKSKTNKTFQAIDESQAISEQDVKKNALELLKKS